MADNICFALLRSTLYQLLHSAGFEASHGEPANVLTDVFGQYIQLLATAASSHAQLAGRTVASHWDIMDGLGDVQVTLDQLDEWLESEQGQFLTPAWSAQTDPSLVIKDVVTKGMVHHEIDSTLYEYDSKNQQYRNVGHDNTNDMDFAEESQSTTVKTTQPDYIPSHLPAFPIKEPEVDPTSDESTMQTSYPTLLSSLLPSTDHKSSKKANGNPFTQLVSFDESSLASGNGLFLTLVSPTQQKHKHQDEDDKEDLDRAKKRRRAEMNGSMEATINTIVQQYKHQRHIKMDGNQHMFQHITQNEAAPGKTLLGTRDSMLDEIVYRFAPPLALARLDSPNLIMDTNTFGEDEDKPLTHSVEQTLDSNDSNLVPPRQLESPQPTVKVPMSMAMLSSRTDNNLAKKDGQQHSPPVKAHIIEPTTSSPQPSLTTNVSTLNSTTPPTPQLKKSNVLGQTIPQPRQKTHMHPTKSATKSASAATTHILNPTIPSSPRPKMKITNRTTSTLSQGLQQAKKNTANLAQPILQSTKTSPGNIAQSIIPPPRPQPPPTKTGTGKIAQFMPQSCPQPTKTITINVAQSTSQPRPIPVKKVTVDPTLSSAPVKTNSAVTTTPSLNPAIVSTLRTPPSTSMTTAPILKKKKTEDRLDPARLKVRFEDDPTHHLLPPHMPPYLSTNRAGPPNPGTAHYHSIPTSFPRSSPVPSRENVKLTMEPWKTTITPQPPVIPAYDPSETVRCLCENPTVDYGSFMISCDKCLVWFHGTCVGITEQMHIEEWICLRCRH